MPDLFVSISEGTFDNLVTPAVPDIPDIETYNEICQAMYEWVATKGETNLELAARSTEFHMFGLTGAPNGHMLSKMIWSISQFAPFFANVVNAQTAFVASGPIETVTAAAGIPTVYAANTAPLGIYAEVRDTSSIDNVETLSWVQIRQAMPEIDLALVVVNYLTDPDVTTSICNALKSGGLFILSNASNGGELYNKLDQSFAQSVHDDIMATGDFYSIHLQGYISYTMFLKK